MKKFILRSCFFILFTFLLLEVVSRVVLDPVYFYTINPYLSPSALTNFTPKDLLKPAPTHADFLFIGSSRVAASINETTFVEGSPQTSINVGRGYTTAGTHLIALQKIIKNNPNFLKDAKVFIELPGGVIYEEDSIKSKYEVFESMPHLLLPHIDQHDVSSFLASNNSNKVKRELCLSYIFSSYRTFPFVKEYKERIINKIITKFDTKKETSHSLEDTGGIKTGKEEIDAVKQMAVNIAQRQLKEQKGKQPLTSLALDRSMIACFHKLIVSNGGELILFPVPLHSIQQQLYSTPLSLTNKEVFSKWCQNKQIEIVNMNEFKTSDDDFPDYWHLGKHRKDEFSQILKEKVLN